MSVIKPNIPYEGLVSPELFFALTLAGRTLSNNQQVQLLTGIKRTMRLPNLTSSPVLQAYACEMTTDGDFGLDQRELTVCDLTVFQEECKIDFDFNYYNRANRFFDQADGMANIGPNQALTNAFLGQMQIHVSNFTEYLIWDGGLPLIITPPAGLDLTLCDGFLFRLQDEGGFIGVPTRTGDLSDPNTVVAELDKIYNAMSDEMYSLIEMGEMGGNELILYTSLATRRALDIFFTSQIGVPPAFTIERRGRDYYYRGVRLFFTQAIPANYAVLTHRDNLFVGTDGAGDFESIQVLDRQQYNLAQKKLQFSMEYRLGTQINFIDEVVYYIGIAP